MHGRLRFNKKRNNYVLLNLVEESIEIEAWLFLTFFMCLHNPFNSVLLCIPLSHIQEYIMFQRGDSLNK